MRTQRIEFLEIQQNEPANEYKIKVSNWRLKIGLFVSLEMVNQKWNMNNIEPKHLKPKTQQRQKARKRERERGWKRIEIEIEIDEHKI